MPFALSQSISVELSVVWETQPDIFEKDSMVNTPKLHITYHNDSDSNYYFLKVYDNEAGLPDISCQIMINYADPVAAMHFRNDLSGRAKLHKIYSNWKFDVYVGLLPYLAGGWNVVSERGYGTDKLERNFTGALTWDPILKTDLVIDIEKDTLYVNEAKHRQLDTDINCDLMDIYNYIFHSNYGERKWEDTYFSPSHIIPENILDSVKNHFVFLKPMETYTDTFNLIGFKMVKGCFTFLIDHDYSWDYVVTGGFWDEEQEKWVDIKTKLPTRVGNYTLYSGSFSSNKVEVCFGEESK
jgi:hypothetical protein